MTAEVYPLATVKFANEIDLSSLLINGPLGVRDMADTGVTGRYAGIAD
jgi:hypothetical protein